VSQGYPAVVELTPSLLERVLRTIVDREFPSTRTFSDPRPGRGPYALIPNVRLTLAEPSVQQRPDAALIGIVATLQETSTGETGSYAIYFDVRGERAGELSLYVELVDPARSQPISHLPPVLLHLALAGQGPIAWPTAPGVLATLRTILGEPGRALLFVTSTALIEAEPLRPAPNPIVPPAPLLRRIPGGRPTQGGGPVQVLHDEAWAAQIDEAVLRSLIVEAITGVGTLDAEGSSIQVTRIAVPRLLAGGLEIELEAIVDGAPCSARGPLYIGYYLERASSDVPLLRTSFNATKLETTGSQALPGVLYALTALVPAVLLVALPGIPATLETWVYGPSHRGRARATNQGTRGPLATLVGDALRLLPSSQAPLGRQVVVRLDFGSQGLTLGVAYRPPPRSGVTKTPLEVPLRVDTVEPATILIGWRRPNDLFHPEAEASDATSSGPAPKDISRQELAISGLAPLGEPRRRSPSTTLYLSGAGLDGVMSAHLVSGFHRRALAIVAQAPTRMTLEWPLADAPPGLWDLEFEWSGGLANGIAYSDRLTLRNQVRTYVMEPERHPDDRPLRVLTRGGEPVLLQLACGLITPLTELASLRDRLREAPATDVDVAEVEVPLASCPSEPQTFAIESLGDDEFVVDAGELGRLRVRTLAVKSDVQALAQVEALLGRLPRHELG